MSDDIYKDAVKHVTSPGRIELFLARLFGKKVIQHVPVEPYVWTRLEFRQWRGRWYLMKESVVKAVSLYCKEAAPELLRWTEESLRRQSSIAYLLPLPDKKYDFLRWRDG